MILKETPEDFVVIERMPVCWGESGPYSYYLLSKRDQTTANIIRILAQILQRGEKDIGIAGNKDRVAVTQQVISIWKGPRHDIDVTTGTYAKFLGQSDRPLSLGMHDGNEFVITVRDMSEAECTALKNPNPIFRNLFGDQRFSTDNAAIGKAIVKGDFAEAARLTAKTQPCVASTLQQKPSDALGALKTLPLRLLKLFVNSYQSLLWNRAAEKVENKQAEDKQVILSLPGFGTPPEPALVDVLEEEGVTARDFIVRSMPELSAEGSPRNVYASAEQLRVVMEPDDRHQGGTKAVLSFFLPRGCYATVFVSQLFRMSLG